MKLKWQYKCDNEVKFKFEHESKLRIEIEFEEKNYKTGYETLLKFGVQEHFKSKLTLIYIKYFCNVTAWNGSLGTH